MGLVASGNAAGFPLEGSSLPGINSMGGARPVAPDDLPGTGAKAAFLGVPYDGANVVIGRPGSAMGPEGLRSVSQRSLTWSFEWDIDLREAYEWADCGDSRVVVGNADLTHEQVETNVITILKSGATPVLVGGDHSLPIPGARALSAHLGPDKRMGYLAIDAHMDASYDWGGQKNTNASGVARASELPNVSPENVAIVGTRGTLNPREFLDLVRERGIHLYPMREVKERGMEAVLKDALDRVWDGVDGVYVTWDCDSVDAAHAPGTTEPEPGGLTSHEILDAAVIIGERGFTCFDNVELAPIYDISGITAKLVWRVVSELLFANAKARL